MDYEKLVEQMKWWAEECDRTNFGCQAKKTLQEAATALSMLQAENEKLRAELEQVKRPEGGLTLKYKVSFRGFDYVEADSPEEAEEKAMYEDDAVYEEKKCESVEEVDEFAVSLED